jgi:hypothetical protein
MSTPNGEDLPPRATAGRVGTSRVVAELGRPETPEETAARKAENTRLHRANQTTRNLILALLASLAIVLFTVLLVVRPDQTPPAYVDYRSIAAEAQSGISTKLVAPKLSSAWKSNTAQLRNGDQKSPIWSIGFITPKHQFIGLEEGLATTDAWYATLLGKAQPTGAITIGAIRWAIYDQTDANDPGNFAYSLAANVGTTRFVLHGTTPVSNGKADNGEFKTLAQAISNELPLSEGN